jgi:hypothetical protein
LAKENQRNLLGWSLIYEIISFAPTYFRVKNRNAEKENNWKWKEKKNVESKFEIYLIFFNNLPIR